MFTLKDIEMWVPAANKTSTTIFLNIFEELYGHRPDPESFLFETIQEAIDDLNAMIDKMDKMDND